MSDQGSNQSAATVLTDQPDYAPGSTAIITATGFNVGSTVQFSVQIINPGTDGIVGTTDDTLGEAVTWLATDGAAASDADGAADGALTTTFHVTQDYANTSILLTASQVTVSADGLITPSGPTATHVFTDAIGVARLGDFVWLDANAN